MKIISTFHKLLFFKTSHPYTLGTKIWKNILGSYESKKIICLCRQLNYYQVRVRNETGISLEIILNVSKFLAVSLFTKILILSITPLSFARCVHFTVTSGRRRALLFLRGQMYISGSTFIKNIENFTWHYISMPR